MVDGFEFNIYTFNYFNLELQGRLLTPKDGCGYTKVQHKRIVGGTTAEAGAWPWMSVVIYKNEKGFFANCGKVYNLFVLYSSKRWKN